MDSGDEHEPHDHGLEDQGRADPGLEDQGLEDQARTHQILKEAERRVQEKDAGAASEGSDSILRANKAVYWMSRHWLGIINLLVLVYTAGAILAPVLAYLGLPRLASALYAFYAPFCHQYSFRSYFLFGESFIHPLHEPPLSIVAMSGASRQIGDPEMGYKMALCQRDIALYAAMLGAGLVYGLLPRKRRPKSLPLWIFFVFAFVPMMLDGGIQWLSYAIWQIQNRLMPEPFETIPALRALTGALFGFGIAAVGYPELDKYFTETIETLRRKYGWEH